LSPLYCFWLHPLVSSNIFNNNISLRDVLKGRLSSTYACAPIIGVSYVSWKRSYVLFLCQGYIMYLKILNAWIDKILNFQKLVSVRIIFYWQFYICLRNMFNLLLKACSKKNVIINDMYTYLMELLLCILNQNNQWCTHQLYYSDTNYEGGTVFQRDI
jgi:hypothetical protein